MAEDWKLEGVGPHWLWSEQGGGEDHRVVRVGGAVACSEQVTAADDGVVKIIVTLRYVTIRYDTWYKNIVPKPSDRLTCQCLPLQRI